jgi:DNA helicase II / ATP-dependent DNA helicase PcrA
MNRTSDTGPTAAVRQIDRDSIWAGLNDDQRRAVELVRGPVCILAGAGSGKTTTITRRIANQVATSAFAPRSILALTFTDKAAGEMRARLAALGATGVRVRTFHSAALGQLRHFSREPLGQVLPAKAGALRQLANRLPRPYRFRPAADLATEIEWAKNRRATPERYLDSLGQHEPPIPRDLMQRMFRDYERGKEASGLIDFEDLLELAIRMFDEDQETRERFRARFEAFTVDEFQDVNLLQRSLLERWLGDRAELCAVGDDYQSIYGFTGASPRYLLELETQFPNTSVVRLEANYRSTPQVLALANRLVARLGGARKLLRAVRGDGPDPTLRSMPDVASESAFIVSLVRALKQKGVDYQEMAILYRANYRSEDFEEALAAAHIPFQVRDGAFLGRSAARRITSLFGRSRATDVAREVRAAAERDGWQEDPGEGIGEQELTRQNDLSRLIGFAEEFDDGTRTLAEFIGDLEGRFGSEGEGRGVNLLTYHRAKGLEFDAVFLPRLNEGEMPFRRSNTDDALAEERRLLYVGITRAKHHLTLTWVDDGKLEPSRFLSELRTGDAVPVTRRSRPRTSSETGSPSEIALRRWRAARSRAAGVPAYVIFDDKTLREIARTLPRTKRELAAVPGIGPLRLDGYGDEILDIVGELT